jgi:two-component system C4-dicarboxylate transport sensor histidine kinase DctB
VAKGPGPILAELRRLNDRLEQRVAERTGELEEANRKLQAEIAERAQTDARLHEMQSELFHAARLSAVGQMAGSSGARAQPAVDCRHQLRQGGPAPAR